MLTAVDGHMDPPAAAAALSEAGFLLAPLRTGHTLVAQLSATEAADLRRSSARIGSVLYAGKKYLAAQAALGELREALDRLPAQSPEQLPAAQPSASVSQALALIPLVPTLRPPRTALTSRPTFLPETQLVPSYIAYRCRLGIRAYFEQPAARYIIFGYRTLGWLLWYLQLVVLAALLFFLTTAALHLLANPDELVPLGFSILDAVPSFVGYAGERVWNRTKIEARARWR